jgi:hypothetical protein
MSKGMRIVVGVFTAFVTLSLLHVWLNIGFDKFYFTAAKNIEQSFRVGFLPVT